MAICTGCDKNSKDLFEYTSEDPVENDGSYEDGRFVCGDCYDKLIDLGYDVGSPNHLQRSAARLIKGLVLEARPSINP